MRVAQVGLGFWGWSWFDVVRRVDGVDLVAVADLSEETRARARDELGLADDQVFDSLERALDESDAEAVLVATPPPSHHDLITTALERGRHVLTEKPLATTLAEAHRLLEAQRRSGRILMVSQNYRFRAPARAAQRIVAGGELGELVHVTLAFRRDTRTLFAPGDFRYRMRHPLILDMSIHHVDLIRAVTGQDATEIYCRSWPVPDSPYEHHPATAAIITLSSGATVTYTGDWASRGEETSWNGAWEVLGDQGRLTWARAERVETFEDDMYRGTLAVSRGDREFEPVEQPEPEALDRAGSLDAFRRAVDEGGAVETSAADNIKSLAMVLACIESVETGSPVVVPELIARADPAIEGGVR